MHEAKADHQIARGGIEEPLGLLTLLQCLNDIKVLVVHLWR